MASTQILRFLTASVVAFSILPTITLSLTLNAQWNLLLCRLQQGSSCEPDREAAEGTLRLAMLLTAPQGNVRGGYVKVTEDIWAAFDVSAGYVVPVQATNAPVGDSASKCTVSGAVGHALQLPSMGDRLSHFKYDCLNMHAH
jgi:hypothetical protein